MIKTIFYILLSTAVFLFIGIAFDELLNYFTIAQNNLTQPFVIIFTIISPVFIKMLSLNYIKSVLSIGIFIFVISYMIKFLTGHHLERRKKEEKEKKFLEKEKAWVKQKDVDKAYKQYDKEKKIKIAQEDTWVNK